MYRVQELPTKQCLPCFSSLKQGEKELPAHFSKSTTRRIILFLWFASLSISNGLTQEPLKVLIVTGFDSGSHKWRETTPLVRSILEETKRFEVRVSEDIAILESSSLDLYDTIVLNFGFWEEPEPSQEAMNGLLEFVRQGNGLVSLHFACSAFQNWNSYGELLGRVWKEGTGGHGPRGKFMVNMVARFHPITRGLLDFEADDELYAKLSGDSDIEILASAHSDWSGRVEPIVFVKQFGSGRVYHNMLGHDVRARQLEPVRTLVRRGVEWAATGQVTID